MSKKSEIKKLEKIEVFTHKLGGVKQRFLKAEKYLVDNFGSLSLNRIQKRKYILKRRARRLKAVAKVLNKLGVEVDLEQR